MVGMRLRVAPLVEVVEAVLGAVEVVVCVVEVELCDAAFLTF